MSININHNSGKISTANKDLKLDANGIDYNVNVQDSRITNLLDPVDSQDAVTKIFLETKIAEFDNSNDADTSGLSQIIENIRVDTYVKSVDFVSDILVGGAGLTATLTTTVVGNANRYTINWGDGNTTTATPDATPTHIYANNAGSPFNITVTAFNNTGVGTGSSATKLRENYIAIFTGDPVVTFAAYSQAVGGSAITQWDDGDTVYFENTTTNTSGAVVQYTWTWGDGSSNEVISTDSVAGGAGGGRISHTFALSTESEVQRTVTLSLDAHSSAQPAILPLDDTASYLLYDTHTPDTTSDLTTGINEESINGLNVTFTNNTEATIGSHSTFGTTYRWDFGDGTITTVNAGSNQAGDTGQTITHKYTLPGNNTATDFTGNLQVINSHTSSPFTSTNFVIHVEPDVRANIAGAADTVSDRNGDNQYDVYDGVDYNSINRALVTVSNTSEHSDSHVYNWNDASANNTVAGLTSVQHDFTGITPGNYQLDFTATGTPDITAQTDSANLTFQVNAVPPAPNGLSSKTITLIDPPVGYNPKLAHGFTENSESNPLVAGASLDTNTARRYTSGTINTSIVQNAYNGLTGTVSASVNGLQSGSTTFTSALNENGNHASLVITNQVDANDSISSSTYPTGFFQTFDAKINKPLGEYSVGVNDQRIEHSITGNTNYVAVVSDDNTSVPTNDIASAIVTETTSGVYRYISGIPYYNTGNPQVTISGVGVSNWIGQAYRDTNNVFEITNGDNLEGRTAPAISSQFKSYTDLEDTPYLTNGIPLTNTLNYQFADQLVDITSSSVATIEKLKVRTHNVNGTGAYQQLPARVQVHTVTPFGIVEDSIPVESNLGNGVVTSNAMRIADFVTETTATPLIVGATNYTSTPLTGAVNVSGTKEATVRWGVLEHNITDYSTGYLPVGPDRSADTGTQYFTFAFQRQVVANFVIDIESTGISGLWVAAPGTGIDSASGLSGWLDCASQYAGAGVPGSDTANGGNGSNGCALTGADVVPLNNNINSTYVMTLGAENMSNATNNVVLVRIAIEAGNQVTDLQIRNQS